ncbi:MAG: small basic family protein [Selenomonadaceae bacterium]|nr:small basic family protein [Selenomonadaceae bacterium]
MIISIVGLSVGILLGMICPLDIPVAYSRLFSVALIAALDSVFGGIRADMDGKFDNTIFLSGFVVNALLAAVLVYLGDQLGMDLYMVALIAFGLRVFQNLAIIRRYMLDKKSN